MKSRKKRKNETRKRPPKEEKPILCAEVIPPEKSPTGKLFIRYYYG